MSRLSLDDFKLKGDDFVAPPIDIQPRQATPAVEDEPEEKVEPADQRDAGADKTLADTLQALNTRIEQSSNQSTVLADPNIQEYLRARARGENARIVVGQEEPQPVKVVEAAGPPPDLESMTNAQLVQFMLGEMKKTSEQAIAQTVEERVKAVRSELKPSLDALVAANRQSQQAGVNQQYVALKEKYKDADQMWPLMVQLNKTVQGTSVEELYHLVKLRAGTPQVKQEKIETEKPSQVPSTRRSIRPTGSLSGRKGFSNTLDDALSRTMGGTKEE